MKKRIQAMVAAGASSEDIVLALAKDGNSPEDISKAMAEEGIGEEAMQKALDELDALSKGEGDNIDDLLKAIEEEEAFFKSDDGDADDEKGGEEEEEEEEEEDFGKSVADDEMDELIKASQAFEELTETMVKGMGGIDAQVRSLLKSQMAASNLQIKMAKVIGEMSKSIQELSAGPGIGPKGQLGLGTGRHTAPELVKSRSEIQGLLQKAVEDGTVESAYLSAFGVRGVSALPDHILKTIGA